MVNVSIYSIHRHCDESVCVLVSCLHSTRCQKTAAFGLVLFFDYAPLANGCRFPQRCQFHSYDSIRNIYVIIIKIWSSRTINFCSIVPRFTPSEYINRYYNHKRSVLWELVFLPIWNHSDGGIFPVWWITGETRGHILLEFQWDGMWKRCRGHYTREIYSYTYKSYDKFRMTDVEQIRAGYT